MKWIFHVFKNIKYNIIKIVIDYKCFYIIVFERIVNYKFNNKFD